MMDTKYSEEQLDSYRFKGIKPIQEPKEHIKRQIEEGKSTKIRVSSRDQVETSPMNMSQNLQKQFQEVTRDQ